MTVKKQLITPEFAVYNGDCCKVLPTLPSESVGFSVFSPPFADLYAYSDDPADMSNCGSYEEFFKHFRFLADELYRLLMPGRICALHCMDLPRHKRDGEEIGLKDFPGDIVDLFKDCGFIFHSRHVVWKDPLVAATRTKALGLAHKQIVKDSTMCRMGIADQVLAFRKPGANPVPVSNENGLSVYHGKNPVPRNLDSYIDSDDPKVNKRSHWIWQRYASPVWDDIDQTDVLPFRGARDTEDEKHICPLQLQVIERCIALWSAPKDIVLTPFMGVGSEVFVAVRNGRKGVGVELKSRYYRQAVRNLETLSKKQSSRLSKETD